MTPEAQRIAIAEAQGWKRSSEYDYSLYGVVKCGEPATLRAACYERSGVLARLEHLPDYTNDLNAMHEAEAALNRDNQVRYYWCLADVVNPMRTPDKITFPLIHASAAQRAEAYLRTLGLWKEDQ